MSDLRQAAQQALEALEDLRVWHVKQSTAVLALRAALAEPVQDPDSPERRCGGPGCDMRCCQPVEEPEPVAIADGTFQHDCPIGTLLYAAPPQRLAEPLTDDLLDDIAVAARRGNLYDLRIAIERALKIGGKE